MKKKLELKKITIGVLSSKKMNELLGGVNTNHSALEYNVITTVVACLPTIITNTATVLSACCGHRYTDACQNIVKL